MFWIKLKTANCYLSCLTEKNQMNCLVNQIHKFMFTFQQSAIFILDWLWITAWGLTWWEKSRLWKRAGESTCDQSLFCIDLGFIIKICHYIYSVRGEEDSPFFSCIDSENFLMFLCFRHVPTISRCDPRF